MMKMLLAGLTLIPVTLIGVATLKPDLSPALSISPSQLHTVETGALTVSVTEQGTLESSNNLEIKCLVRGENVITSVVESGTIAEPGQVLVQLETLALDEEISERTKFYHLAESQVARSAADVARAKLAISEYTEGRFVSSLAELQKQLAVAESRLLNATNRHKYSEMMQRSEYASDLEVEERDFAVDQAKLNVDLIRKQIDVLQTFTKKEELVRLQGELNAAQATYEADVERAYADKKRLERAQEELTYCTITADRAGMVIYPTGEEWKDAPEIEEGAVIHKNQVLLLMPDLKQMQVKVGVHESIVDRVHPGMTANVTLNRSTLTGTVASVATVAKPAGWWTGNVVKYDVIVELPQTEGLKPGMSAEVEIVMAEHTDVLTVPVAAVLETEVGYACWVAGETGVKRRPVQIGDSSEMFVVIDEGLNAGESVVIDPLATVPAAQEEVARMAAQQRTNESAFSDL